MRSTRLGVGRAASDVVRAAQSASGAYTRTASNGTSGAQAAKPQAPVYKPQAAPLTEGTTPDLATANVALTRAEIAYKASAAVFKSTNEATETLLDTLL